MNQDTFLNPILRGFYPDPSICAANGKYYIAASSFYYFPGLPIFESEDLVHWRQIGNAISRPDQLDYRDCDNSEGLWAPTIRYHDGRFYIVNTLDVNGREHRYNYVITAENPAGPWSKAVIIEGADGIDPSLFFDDDGRIWFCYNHIPDHIAFAEHKQIILRELDSVTWQFKGDEYILWDAVRDYSLYMEAPHVYKIGDWFYLMTAEGGTQTNHCVRFYRSQSLTEGYVPCPRNPVVSNRGLRMVNALGVSVVGHGDLVQTPAGEWYMVLLGIRPYDHYVDDYDRFLPRMWIRKPDRNQNAQYNLGRETFLVPIAWDGDGWPIVDNENGYVNLRERRPALPWHRDPWQSRVDNFEAASLDLQWVMQRPPKVEFWTLSERPGCLRLYALPSLAEEKTSGAVILRRQQHNDFQAAAAMEFDPQSDGEEAGLLLTQNERFSYLLVKERFDGVNRLACWQILNGKRTLAASVEVPDGRIYLGIEGRPGAYSFYWGMAEHEMQPLALDMDGSFLSTLVADGYVGVLMGMYISNGRSEQRNPQAYADFDWFRYEMIEE